MMQMSSKSVAISEETHQFLTMYKGKRLMEGFNLTHDELINELLSEKLSNFSEEKPSEPQEEST